MNDRYGEFVQSNLGKKLAKNLGLPLPVELERFDMGKPVVRGDVLVGSAVGDDHSLSDAVARILADVHANVYVNASDGIKDALANASVDAKADTGGKDKYKVVVL